MALRVVPHLLYGQGHPYSLPFTGSGTEASVSKMTRADLVKFHDTWFKPNNATLLVVGDTTLAEVNPSWKNYLPREARRRTQKTVPQVPQAGEDRCLSDWTVRVRGRAPIFGAQLAPPRNDPDAIPLQLVNEIFGGRSARAST